jgi:RNA polymerase sigma-70 factor (ECF subfamily)
MGELGDLVGLVARGGPTERLAAERELCAQLAPRIRLYGLRHLRDEAASADLVQDALVVVLQAARDGRVEDPEHVERFVLGTCRNLVARSRRSERRGKSFESAVLPLSEAEMPPAFSRLDAGRLALCLGAIAAREQRVIVMTFQEDLSAEEIATALDTSPGNVRVLRHRAMTALQRCVEGSAA